MNLDNGVMALNKMAKASSSVFLFLKKHTEISNGEEAADVLED